MATYKVIQDIEAEDKFLGPLTLKQFIFGIIGVFFAYLSFFALTKGLTFLLVVFAPPMLLGFFLAVPWSKDQPTEVWVLAKLRFMVKPRRRIWDQSGMEELVTITAPKKEEKQLTDNLSQIEVKSRLKALAQTIDSRGWVVKDAEYNISYRPDTSDRLVNAGALPHEVPPIDVNNIPDAYSVDAPTSENFDRMIQQSTEMRKAQNLEKMDRIRHGEPLESIVLPEVQLTPPSTAYQNYQEAAPAFDEAGLTEELKYRRAPDALATAHMRTLQPIGAEPPLDPLAQSSIPADDSVASTHDSASTDDTQNSTSQTSDQPMPEPQSAAILEYAGNNDLNIATIARQAKKDVEEDQDEVVISLR